MAKPNSRPAAQKANPISSRVWPSVPRKLTDERSGRRRPASPAASAGASGDAIATEVNANTAALGATALAERQAVSQVRIRNPPHVFIRDNWTPPTPEE